MLLYLWGNSEGYTLVLGQTKYLNKISNVVYSGATWSQLSNSAF